MKILIVGGAGFVGANLAVGLAPEHAVTVMDNLVRRGSELNLPRLQAADVRYLHGDARSPEDWPTRGNEAVILTAAQPSAIDGYSNPRYDFTNNFGGALQALEYCRQHGAALIFFSTNKVYPPQAVATLAQASEQSTRFQGQAIPETCPLDGCQRSLYGASKVAADLTIQEWADTFQIPAVINRCSCLAGPWQWGRVQQGWVAWWVIAHHFGLPLTYYGFQGKQVRDVLFIDDLLALIKSEIASLATRATPQVYNVGGGPENAVSLVEMTTLCQQLTGQVVAIATQDEPRRADFPWYVTDTRKVWEAFGWAPEVGLIAGMRQIYQWVCAAEQTLASLYHIQLPSGKGKP